MSAPQMLTVDLNVFFTPNAVRCDGAVRRRAAPYGTASGVNEPMSYCLFLSLSAKCANRHHVVDMRRIHVGTSCHTV